MVACFDIEHFKQKDRLMSDMIHQGGVEIPRATIFTGDLD
jgi:hypothetical protein